MNSNDDKNNETKYFVYLYGPEIKLYVNDLRKILEEIEKNVGVKNDSIESISPIKMSTKNEIFLKITVNDYESFERLMGRGKKGIWSKDAFMGKIIFFQIKLKIFIFYLFIAGVIPMSDLIEFFNESLNENLKHSSDLDEDEEIIKAKKKKLKDLEEAEAAEKARKLLLKKSREEKFKEYNENQNMLYKSKVYKTLLGIDKSNKSFNNNEENDNKERFFSIGDDWLIKWSIVNNHKIKKHEEAFKNFDILGVGMYHSYYAIYF